MRVILLSVLLCLTLTACGTKGPLYIPEQKYPQNQVNKPKQKPAQDTQQSTPAESNAPEDNPEISK